MRSIAFVLCLVALFCVVEARPKVDKIALDDLTAKHVEAIGNAEARRPGRSRIVAGGSLMNLRTGGSGNVSGAALIASQEERVLLKAEFTSASYPFEKLGFDGQKFHARPYGPGQRSPLARFLLSHDVIFSDGLIGGTLSSACRC